MSEVIGRKLKIQKRHVPAVLKSGIASYLMLGVTLVLAFLNITGRVKLPFVAIMTAAGFLVTLRYTQAVWHNYLCPYGVILRLPSRFARFRMNVGPECIPGCDKCARVCPAESVTIGSQRADIDPSLCLVCQKCTMVCPTVRQRTQAGLARDVSHRLRYLASGLDKHRHKFMCDPVSRHPGVWPLDREGSDDRSSIVEDGHAHGGRI